MKLASYEWRGECHVGLYFDGKLVSLAQALGTSGVAVRSMSAFLADAALFARTRDWAARLQAGARPPAPPEAVCALSDVRLLPPVPDPEKIICIGLNYIDHARESGMAPPPQPVFFAKYRNALAGPNDPVRLPPVSEQVDYEVELAVVIGRRGRHLREDQAMDYVAGYMILNDVSARDLQFKTGQWINGKTMDTFAPCGPFLVTKDEVMNPHALTIKLSLNGAVMQHSTTANLIFNIPQLIAHLSKLFTLVPGDIISTGTPPGVGFARKPPVFLKPGDRLRLEIEQIGVLEHPVVGERDYHATQE